MNEWSSRPRRTPKYHDHRGFAPFKPSFQPLSPLPRASSSPRIPLLSYSLFPFFLQSLSVAQAGDERSKSAVRPFTSCRRRRWRRIRLALVDLSANIDGLIFDRRTVATWRRRRGGGSVPVKAGNERSRLAANSGSTSVDLHSFPRTQSN